MGETLSSCPVTAPRVLVWLLKARLWHIKGICCCDRLEWQYKS